MKIVTCYLILFFVSCNIYFATGQGRGIEEIERAIKANQTEKANNLLQSLIDTHYAKREADSLVNYVFYVGKISQERSGTDAAVKKIQLFIEKIQKISSNPATLRQAYLEAGEFYGSVGLNKKGYAANQQALGYNLLMPDKTGSSMALLENNMATYAQRFGDLDLSKSHSRQAFKYLQSDKNPDYEILYNSYNGMATAMWYSSKTDSALYYFNKALETLDKTPRTARNQFYRPAIIQNNLAGLYQLEGNTSKAIVALKSTISNLEEFLASKAPDTKKNSAISFQFEATDNLAGIYKELGDLAKARELLEYSYQQKQKKLTPDDPGIFISKILLGQLYFARRENEKALQFLNDGLIKIAQADGDYLFWQADACNTLALIYDAIHDVAQATHFYEKADSLYEASLQGEYDNIYLDFLRNAALFYAENKQPQTGIAKAHKGYRYIVKTQGPHTLMAFYQLLNLSEIYFISGDYTKSLAYSKQGLDVVTGIIRTSSNLLDSVRMELKKPKALLQKAKAEYMLLKNKDVAGLSGLLVQLDSALSLLERQKMILSDPQDISFVMSDNAELIEFIEKITFDLYRLTHDQAYIGRLTGLHESSMYNRIRSRLDKNDTLRFANVPPEVLVNERKFKHAISSALTGEGSHEEKIQRYLKAIDDWNRFREKIRIDYPRYYKMRYASIFKSTDKAEKYIPENTTLIRYFFIEKKLFALVADRNRQEVLALNDKDYYTRSITGLLQFEMDEEKTSGLLYSLYQQLWAPLAEFVRYKRVVIIPDGILYNLNFEILTPSKISSFRELASKSLLADYTISYHYSLFLLGKDSKTTALENNFVAFAPGFSDKIKNDYLSVAGDSSQIDKAYLSLLPQPFATRLAIKTRKLLGGEAFMEQNSTISSFRANAGNHRIIHIGTHAESNNDYPEFSKLIFAKNISDYEENNSLFVDEIYNCDLTSNLAVLTACESGKPGYQDGEGMISLAHAFNYAGSESILTGLWKIDEQASSLLVDDFYKGLLKGLPKDEALREAKLAYLRNNTGRMLAPQYWAGLVIMGDAAPVMLQQKTSFGFMIFLSTVFVLLGSFFIIRRIWSKPSLPIGDSA